MSARLAASGRGWACRLPATAPTPAAPTPCDGGPTTSSPGATVRPKRGPPRRPACQHEPLREVEIDAQYPWAASPGSWRPRAARLSRYRRSSPRDLRRPDHLERQRHGSGRGVSRCSRPCWPTPVGGRGSACPLARAVVTRSSSPSPKRLHNVLHGGRGRWAPRPGGAGGLPRGARAERRRLDPWSSPVTSSCCTTRSPPSRARGLGERGAHVVWRCHIGRDTPTELRPGLGVPAPAHIQGRRCLHLPRRAYAPDWVPADRLWVIPRHSTRSAPRTRSLSPAGRRRRPARGRPEEHPP